MNTVFSQQSRTEKMEMSEPIPKTGENVPTYKHAAKERNAMTDIEITENAPNKQKRGLCVGFDCCGCHWWI